MKNKYRVLDSGRFAKHPFINVDSSWDNCDFETEKEAREYANKWLGSYGPLPKDYKVGDEFTYIMNHNSISIVKIIGLDINKVLANISNAMESLEGEEVARIHNDLCAKKIRYLGDDDSAWEYTGEDD